MAEARLSIIIPALNEAAGIVTCLRALREIAPEAQIILADGGSVDGTPGIARGLCDDIIACEPGRAHQMNAGAGAASGDLFLFLHADTRLPEDAIEQIVEAVTNGRAWGRFDVRIDGRSAALPLIAHMMNWRSRLTGIATGDMGLFMTRAAFEAAGGFPGQRLMEDIEMSRRLKRIGPPACLAGKAVTSGRRWDTHGAMRTILLMWRLRLAYWAGADPDALATRYGYGQGRATAEEGKAHG